MRIIVILLGLILALYFLNKKVSENYVLIKTLLSSAVAILSIILILFYYILSFSFSSLSIAGVISPFLGAWAPVFISLSGGVYLLNKADD